MLVDYVYQEKYTSKVKRLMKGARFRIPAADVHEIYYVERHLDREQLLELSTCQFISNNMNVVFQGFTGSGKSYLACALGKEACKQTIRTRYIRMPDLLMEWEEARQERNGVPKLLKRYSNYRLLILDEWLTNAMTDDELSFLFELFERRYDCTSTIFCSLYDTSDWVARLGGGTRAESITERFVHNSYCIDTGDMNMRELYSTRDEKASSGRKASA